LTELKESGFEIVEGDPDIRGWDVRNSVGKRIGKVDELVLDTLNKKVRYMVVDLHKNDLDLNDRKVLFPIGLAELHKDDDDVILPQVNTSQLTELPEYEKDRLDVDVEREICKTLGRKQETTETNGGLTPDPEFYKHDYYNDDNLYRNRLREVNEQKKETEFEKGLRLWEKRSDGGIIPENRRESGGATTGENATNFSEGERSGEREGKVLEINRDRKSNGQDQRQQRSSGNRYRSGKTIEDRIRREGLRDPGDKA
jgi:sporulation protein YlmC with PRC-barrel domain